MARVILQPAGDPYARQHYVDSIANPVVHERLSRFLSPEEMAELRRLYGDRSVPAWGVTPGGRDVNRNKWQRVEPGDFVLMARDSEIFVSARVTMKAHNEPLAEDLWGRDDNQSTWEYLYFLTEISPQELSVAQLNSLVGYRSGARIQGFNVLD